MSKRAQEATSNEGSPMAKPQPTILAKARFNLVARSPWSEEDSSKSLGYLVNPVNADERKEVEIATGNSWRFKIRIRIFSSESTRGCYNGPRKHLGPNYLANLEVYKNTNFEEIESLFNTTRN